MSFILPASAIMYASGSTDNSNDSSTSGSSTSGSSTSGSTTDNSGSSTSGSTTDNSGSSTSGSTGNNATLPTTSTVSNNTGNAYCDSCNNDIYNGGGDLKSMVLAVHNRERAAVSVPPLMWSDKLAADAKAWADHLATLGKIVHCVNVPGCDTHGEGENLASGGHTTTVPIAQNMQGWIAEKNVFQGLPSATGTDVVGHYTQMVWKSTTQIGCGTASGGPNDNQGWDILVCRYLPWGNTGPNPFQ